MVNLGLRLVLAVRIIGEVGGHGVCSMCNPYWTAAVLQFFLRTGKINKRFFLFVSVYLLAAQCKVHLVDVILVKGAEAGCATILAHLAALVAWSVLREGRVEKGVIVENRAIFSNLRLALKRLDGDEARVTLTLCLTELLAELMQIYNVTNEDLLVALLDSKVPVEPPESTGEITLTSSDLIII